LHDVADVADVAIIGFGPSGAVAAALLGAAGLKVLVLEQSKDVYDKPRAISIDHEIMRVLQGLSPALAQRIVAHTEPFSPSEHYGADGKMIRRLDMLAPPYPLGWTPSMVFLQPPVEALLREHVGSLPSVDVRLGFKLSGLAQTVATCDLACVDTEGKTQSLRARYVIGCDGASSSVRRFLDLPLDDLGFDEPWLVVDVIANDKGLAKLPKASAQFCEPSRPASYLIGTGRHRRWEIMLLPGENPQAMESDEQVWQLLSRWISPDEGTLWRRASYRFHALVAKKWRLGNVFIAGDAAHQQPPFLGQGMCQGIRDVANLSWKLSQVITSQATDALLDTYGEERSAHVRQLTATIKMIGASICERDPEAAKQRDMKLLQACEGVVKTVPRQDLIPKLSTGFLFAAAHPAIGSLFVQPSVKVGGETALLDDIAGAGWRVVLGDTVSGWLPDFGQKLFTLLRFSSDGQEGTLQESDHVLRNWFSTHQVHAAIIRPDHYVFAVAKSEQELIHQITELKRRLTGDTHALK
jgi:3-(3-hydroxy-phenyl)propionate hydroxylase